MAPPQQSNTSPVLKGRSSKRATGLSEFLQKDRAFAAMFDDILAHGEAAKDDEKDEKDEKDAREKKEKEKEKAKDERPKKDENDAAEPQTSPRRKPPLPPPPLEERAFADVAPGLDAAAPLRLVRLHPRTGVVRAHRLDPEEKTAAAAASGKGFAGLLRSGFDVILSAIGSNPATPPAVSPPAPNLKDRNTRKGSVSPKKRKSSSPEPPKSRRVPNNAEDDQTSSEDPLQSMFDDEPPPLEFTIPSELPSFHITFTKPVPQPRYELIKKKKKTLLLKSASTSSSRSAQSSSTFGRWGRASLSNVGYDGDDHSSDDEEEICNGRSVGYSFDFKENQYFRYIEPTEEELNSRIEYDMDEQDKAWLAAQNAQRHSASSEPPIPDILFEFIMDRLEKEWFDLFKQIPKPQRDLDEPEDINCAICDDGECENSNAIVFCDGCNLAVHQDCYGVPFIPEGQWLCRRCMVSPDRPVSCCLCPNENGALKQTNSNRWAHVVCAQWIPEASFGNATYMEPIDSKSVPSSRYKLTCYLCGRKKGACIQCSTKSCYASYHVTCAKKCKLFMKIGDDMKSHCDKHAPKEYRDQIDVEKEIFLFRRQHNLSHGKFKTTPELEAELLLGFHEPTNQQQLEDDASASPPSKKTKRETSPASNNYSAPNTRKRKQLESDAEEDEDNDYLGEGRASAKDEIDHELLKAQDEAYKRLIATPIIPLGICRAVSNAIRGSSAVRGKNAFVEKCCRYWALKREGRRGAPLLKRLHLEPWTATSTVIQQDETIRAKRIDILKKIRNDLERVRMLCELVKKRERERLKRSNTQLQIMDLCLNPLTFILRPILLEIRKLDVKGLFEEPVDLEAVPDYLSVVGKAMSFEEMEEKVEDNEYRSVSQFKDDFLLICRNAQLYNRPDTPWYRAADRLLTRSGPALERAFEQEAMLEIDKDTGCLANGVPESVFDTFQDSIPAPISTRLSPKLTTEDPSPLSSLEESQSSLSVSQNELDMESKGAVASQHQLEENALGDDDAQERQLLEDERLAKALHEQELMESPRSRRRIGESPSRISAAVDAAVTNPIPPTTQNSKTQRQKKKSANSTDAALAAEPVGDLVQRRRSSLRLGGLGVLADALPVPGDNPNDDLYTPQKSAGFPDAKIRRIIQEASAKLEPAKSSSPLAFASIYLPEDETITAAGADTGRNLKSRRSSSRVHVKKTVIDYGIFGDYPQLEDQEFELPKDLRDLVKKRRR
ncbi:hypothetical protein BDR26DRAFT_922828 [Obelidium mucronatum]|nr:hypothetical protein BDR26DRAFT_922828 [Obelidium mucronatum]